MVGFFNRKIIIFITFILLILLPTREGSAQIIGETGLSFVAFSKNAYYGMNLDTSIGELRFRIDEQNKRRALFIDILIDSNYQTIAAYNDNGIFITYQNYLNSDSPVFLSPQEFKTKFGDLLFQSTKIPDASQITGELSDLQISFTNQLFASEYQKAFIIESYTGVPQIIDKKDGWIIQSSLASSFSKSDYSVDYYHPHQQQIRAEEEIRKYMSDFSLMDGFRVLEAADPEQTMTASIVMDVSRNQIYIVLDKEFEKIWMINLDGVTIETFSGFEKYHKGNMPEIGLTSSDLRILNFSNESLMNGVIIAGAVIIIVILIVIGTNYLRFLTEKIEKQS